MNWTTASDVRAQVQKLWDRGEILASRVDGVARFPKRLQLKGPSSAELASRFDQVRAWIGALRGGAHYRVEMRTVQHRILGANQVPDAIWVDSLEDALALIGKTRELRRFDALLALTRRRQPLIVPWLATNALKALELEEAWPHLLDVIDWLRVHPRPAIYLRQMDIAGIHSKFIESQRAVLSALLDLALEPAAIDADATGVSQFCRRYGFLDKPPRIRFRMLDPAAALLPCPTDQDITLDQTSFALLNPPLARVFITENEINFLAFPPRPASMVIFGAGYGFEALARADWLRRCTLHYWGDIDTHGFAILDQLRSHFPQVQSFLMDRQTLLAHETHWGTEPAQLCRDLPRLTPEEQALFDDLRDNRIRPGLRLEQEKIGFGRVLEALART